MFKTFPHSNVIKVDVEKREVWGTLALEEADKDGEIMDFAASRPYWEAWSSAIKTATDGKSLGNVRQMHNPGLPIAGKLTHIEFDETAKKIIGCTKVTDDQAWKNCLEGVYTGFSLGGNYIGSPVKEAATGLARYTINPVEVSLVDNPCQPGATFDLVRLDGSVVKKNFAAKAVETGKGNAMAKTALVEKARGKISDAEKLLKGISTGQVQKGMYAIGSLANLVCDLNWMTQDAEWEASAEGDASEVPGMLRGILKQLAEALKAMTAEEVSELIGTEGMTTKMEKIEITKAQADHLETIGKIGKKIHAAHQAMGTHIDELLGTNSEEKPSKTAVKDDEEETSKGIAASITKALAPTLTQINVVLEENKALKTQLTEQTELFTELSNVVLKMAGEPSAAAMPKASDPVAVTKAAEVAGKVAVIDEKNPNEVMKMIRSNGPTGLMMGNGAVQK